MLGASRERGIGKLLIYAGLAGAVISLVILPRLQRSVTQSEAGATLGATAECEAQLKAQLLSDVRRPDPPLTTALADLCRKAAK